MIDINKLIDYVIQNDTETIRVLESV